MKTRIKVRKIPTEDILNILLEMRELGVEYVDFECEMTPEKDIVHVTEYRAKSNPNQKTIDYESNSEEHLKYINKIINRDGSSN